MDMEPAGFHPIDEPHAADLTPAPVLPPSPPATGWGTATAPIPATPVPPAPGPRTFLSLRWWLWPVILAGIALTVVGAVVVTTDDESTGAPGTTDDPSQPTVTAVASLPRPADGVSFTDPQGDYTIEIGPDWTKLDVPAAPEVEQWFVGTRTEQFTPNVNMLTQEVGDMSLQQYIAISKSNLSGLHVISSTIVQAGGAELCVFEYAGTITGSTQPLHFLAVFGIKSGNAVLATFAGTEQQFAALRSTIEPYLRTLVLR